jgi:ComF family protein
MNRIITLLLDLVFQANCKSCGNKMKSDRKVCFCNDCWKAIKTIREPFCIYCGKQLIIPEEHFCAICTKRRLSYIDNRSAGIYEGTLKEALHQFKYKGKKSLGKALGDFLSDYIKERGGLDDIDLIIPVPISESKREKREYNQSEILAMLVGQRFDLPVLKDVLFRTKDTVAQFGLRREERFNNVRGVFEVLCSEKIKWASVLLIDDLLTTGATADECSKALLEAGASQIRVFTLARGL